MKLLKYFIILLFLITSVVSSELEFTENEIQWIKDNPTVKLGADYKWPPFDFVDSKGKHTGLSSEYINLISKKSGLKFSVDTGVWSDVLNGMKAKKYDGLTCAVETDERKKYLNFSDPYLSVSIVIITQISNKSIKTIDDLFGKTVSINKGSYIHEWLQKHYPKINLHLTTSNEASLEAVSLGKADAYVGNLAVATYIMNKYLLNNLKTVKKLKDFETSVSVAIDKNNIVLFNIIQKSLNSITINEHQDIKSKWNKILNTEKKSSELLFSAKQKEWIKNNPTVKLGADDSWAPFDFADNNGEHTGLSSEYIKLVSKKSGLKFDIKTDLWSNILKDMKSKKYDGLVCAVETQERKKYLKFTNPYLNVPTVLVIQNENSEIKTIDSLDGLTLSVTKDSYTHEWLKTSYPKMKLHLSSSDKESLEAVSLGKADAYIGNLAVATYLKNKHLLYNLKIISIVENLDTKVSMAVDKEKIILFDIIQKSLKSITPREHLELKGRWEKLDIKNKNTLRFTKKQQEWIENHKTIKFVIDNQWKPMDYLSENSKVHKGIASSYIELISKKTGIEFTLVHTEKWSQSVEKINSREADMYSCVANTTSKAKVVDFSIPYLEMPQIFVTNKETKFITDIKELYGKKIVLIKEYYITDRIKKEHPQIEVVEVENIIDAYKILTSGGAYAYIDILPVASYYIQKEGYTNLKISGMSSYESKFSIALRNDWKKEGIEIINMALASITDKEKSNIYNKWSHVKYDKEVDYTIVWQLTFLFLLFILGTLYWNRKLSKLNSKIEEQKRVFETIYEKATDAILLIDNGRFIDCNEATVNMLQFKSKEQFLNTHPSKLSPEFQPDGKLSFEKANEMIEIAMKNSSHYFEWIHTKSDGEIFWVDVVLTKINLNHKDIIHVRWIDIQKKKEIQKELEKSIKDIKKKNSRIEKILKISDKQQKDLIVLNYDLEEATSIAQSANRAKSDFLSSMSHEIRTPMNAILGFAELLDKEIEDKKLKSFVKTIRSSGQTLLFLINDILDLSKIESGKLELVESRVNLQNIFEETLNIFKLQAEQKELKFEFTLDDNMPKALLLDQVRLKEILINLIGNAFKFTQEGYIKVVVIVDKVYEHTSKIDLTIMVKDSGIGISKFNQEKIFNIFEQSENQDTKKYGGTGLGLAISRKLANLMGGSLRVESELGKGSNFIVSLKNIDIVSLADEDTDSESSIDYSSINFESAVLLIVDDIKENRDLVKENFSDTEINIIEASDGKTAIEIAKSQELDMILMDIRMPIMDGYTATRLIREFSSVPIVALTASIMEDELKKLEGEKFSGYLRKPVSREELFKKISKYIPYTTNVTEEKEKEEVIINNTKELRDFLDSLKPEVEILYKEAKSTNNISMITDFSKALLVLSLKHNIEYMIEYSELLLDKIDAFEINSISEMLNDYEDKIEALTIVLKKSKSKIISEDS